MDEEGGSGHTRWTHADCAWQIHGLRQHLLLRDMAYNECLRGGGMDSFRTYADADMAVIQDIVRIDQRCDHVLDLSPERAKIMSDMSAAVQQLENSVGFRKNPTRLWSYMPFTVNDIHHTLLPKVEWFLWKNGYVSSKPSTPYTPD